jgi:hypothetical protein
MKVATRQSKAPVKGASRVYRLVPANEEDVFAWARAYQEARGWTVLEEDYRIRVQAGPWIMVELWAIPPAAGEAP